MLGVLWWLFAVVCLTAQAACADLPGSFPSTRMRGSVSNDMGTKIQTWTKNHRFCRKKITFAALFVYNFLQSKVLHQHFSWQMAFSNAQREWGLKALFLHRHFDDVQTNPITSWVGSSCYPLQCSTPLGIAGIRQMGVVFFCVGVLFLMMSHWELSLQTRNLSIQKNTNA